MRDPRALRLKIAQLGVTHTAWHLLMSRLRPWLLLARIYRTPIDQYSDAAPEPRFDLHVPSQEEFACAYKHFGHQLDPQKVEAALARGDVCMAAFDRENDNRMVGFAWGAPSTAPHGDGLWVAVDFPNLYGYKAYVDPAYRGRGINRAMITERDRATIGDGFNASVGFIETHNYPSIQSNIHLGSEPVGYVGYVKLFGRAYPFHSPKARNTSLRFYRKDRDRVAET